VSNRQPPFDDIGGRDDALVASVPFSVSRAGLEGSVGLIELSGELDISTAPKFKEELEALISDGFTNVVVDLSAVEFIDSSALGVLVGAVRRLHPHNGRMVVVAHSHAVTRPLTLTGLDRVFTVTATREEALATF
jgi:anti-sigma B factor antagonist